MLTFLDQTYCRVVSLFDIVSDYWQKPFAGEGNLGYTQETGDKDFENDNW